MKTQSKLRILVKYFLIWLSIIFVCMILMYTNLYYYMPTFYDTFLYGSFLIIMFLCVVPTNYFVPIVIENVKYLEFIMCIILWDSYELFF